MLEEPEHRIGDDVVVPVVRLLVVRDEVEAIGRPVTRGLVDRLTGERAVLLGDGTRDPRHVVVLDETPQCRHESAAAAARRALAALVPAKGDGTPIRDDDQLPAHARGKVYPARPRPKRP